jgi:hypothetical protein
MLRRLPFRRRHAPVVPLDARRVLLLLVSDRPHATLLAAAARARATRRGGALRGSQHVRAGQVVCGDQLVRRPLDLASVVRLGLLARGAPPARRLRRRELR